MTDNSTYEVGDWIVHSRYGVGQIKAIEVKPLHGENAEVYRATTKDSTFWFPTNGEDNPRIRPISSQDFIKKVISTLRRKPGNLSKDKKHWKKEIKKVKKEGDMLRICKLIRDLSAQSTQRNLIQSEKKALDKYKERLLREWAVIVDKKVDDIRPRLQSYLKESKAKVETK